MENIKETAINNKGTRMENWHGLQTTKLKIFYLGWTFQTVQPWLCFFRWLDDGGESTEKIESILCSVHSIAFSNDACCVGALSLYPFKKKLSENSGYLAKSFSRKFKTSTTILTAYDFWILR